jgi:hypothetical protein
VTGEKGVNRIQFITELIKSEFYWERGTLIAALVSCLTPEETCESLDLEFSQEPYIRRAILRKISRDMERGVQECHHQLIEQLIQAAQKLPYNKKNSCGYCLIYLYDYLPEEVQRAIIRFFVTSKYIVMRRRAYKKLRSHWSPEYQSLILDAWEKHKDFECALLVAENFPLLYIEQHLAELEETLMKSGPRYLAKLFLRVGEADNSKLNRLANLDEITFAYVSAKLQRPLTEERALQIFDNNRLDGRIGLLIWCFGQMGMWSVLVSIADRTKEFDQEKLAYVLERWGKSSAEEVPKDLPTSPMRK